MIHGDVNQAMLGLDSADLKILLCHDPNQWAEDVKGKTNIEITLSGHTHGMQMGIMTKKFKWSPAKYFYPHWNGLYYLRQSVPICKPWTWLSGYSIQNMDAAGNHCDNS